jgi:hypothetical protein
VVASPGRGNALKGHHAPLPHKHTYTHTPPPPPPPPYLQLQEGNFTDARFLAGGVEGLFVGVSC